MTTGPSLAEWLAGLRISGALAASYAGVSRSHMARILGRERQLSMKAGRRLLSNISEPPPASVLDELGLPIKGGRVGTSHPSGS